MINILMSNATINESTVDSEVRFKVEIDLEGFGDVSGYSIIQPGDDFLFNGEYYVGSVGFKPNNQSIVVIKEIILGGSTINNHYMKKKLTVKILFEVKQKDYVDWTKIDEIYFP
ncbi:MAG: hypothetical protein RBQ97_04195 [Acholeplasma sp.]|nr:hypothetical protein [Acholeplasma sp.]